MQKNSPKEIWSAFQGRCAHEHCDFQAQIHPISQPDLDRRDKCFGLWTLGSWPEVSDCLRDFVDSIERAPPPLRRIERSEAVAVFDAMIRGEWSLFEHFDTIGRQFFVARRNQPTERNRGLSERERTVVHAAIEGQSNKEIAFALDLTPSTVATHLRAALLKIGVGSRRELIQLGQGLRRGQA